MKKMYIIIAVIVFVVIVVFTGYLKWRQNSSVTDSIRKGEDQYFKKNVTAQITEAEFKVAIDKDDPAAVDAIIRAGATANDRWEAGTTPVEYAVAKYSKKALAELFKNGGDPNLRDQEFAILQKNSKNPDPYNHYESGDNAVTLAAETYAKDPAILALVLKAGGDPNTKRVDEDPVIIRFINDRNLEGIKFMKSAGADINARNRSDSPLIIDAGILEYWDVVDCLIGLGANYNYPDEPIGWPQIFSTPYITQSDSPQYSYKVKVWKFLTQHGIKLAPLE